MSHFSVAVISKNKEDVEKLLAPFQENNMGDCPKEYLKFNNVEKEYRQQYENEDVEMIITPLKNLIYKWDAASEGLDIKNLPQEYKIINVKHKNHFLDFDTFMKEWADCERDKITGEYGYWENPNAKWDWWVIGGRWKNYIKTNNGTYVNQCKIKDLDTAPDIKEYKFAIRFWEINVEKDKFNEGENKDDFFCFYKPEYYIEQYSSKEEYAKNESSFKTFALISSDGKWYEQGQMGWFGMSDTTSESRITYKEIFDKILNETDPEYYITIVDCHI